MGKNSNKSNIVKTNIYTDGKILRDSLKAYIIISLPNFIEKLYKLYTFEFICDIYSKLEKLPIGSDIVIIGDFCTSKSTLINILDETFPHLYYREVQLKHVSDEFTSKFNSILVENKHTLKGKK